LTVGPVTGQWRELFDLAKTLYGWTVESMLVASLRKPFAEGSYDPQWKQIKLLERLLASLHLAEDEVARRLTAPLRSLNALRISSAHATQVDLVDAFEQLGATATPSDARGAWELLVDSLSSCLHDLAGIIRG
jgi:hypothetical protein